MGDRETAHAPAISRRTGVVFGAALVAILLVACWAWLDRDGVKAPPQPPRIRVDDDVAPPPEPRRQRIDPGRKGWDRRADGHDDATPEPGAESDSAATDSGGDSAQTAPEPGGVVRLRFDPASVPEGMRIEVTLTHPDGTTSASGTPTDGLLTIAAEHDRMYAVTVSAPGRVTWWKYGVYVGDDALDIALPAATTLRGRVVTIADGAPIADAEIRVEDLWDLSPAPERDEKPRPPFASVQSGADGTFEAGGLPRDTLLSVTVSHTGFASVTEELTVDFAEQRGVERKYELHAGGVITGSLTDIDGAAVSGAEVWAVALSLIGSPSPLDLDSRTLDFAWGPAASIDGHTSAIRKTRTTSDGSFEIIGVRFGEAHAVFAFTESHSLTLACRSRGGTLGSLRRHLTGTATAADGLASAESDRR